MKKLNLEINENQQNILETDEVIELSDVNVEIALTGTEGTLTNDEFAKVQANPSNVVFSLGGRKFIHNEDATNYVSYSNVVYPTTDTQEIKVIYVNTSSEAVNYKHWNVEDEEPSGAVEIDETSITKNSDGEIQAEGVIDQNTGNANKEWTGTRAEYDLIAVKDTNTFYNITDEQDSSGLVIETESTTTVQGYAVPVLTAEQVQTIYDAVSSGQSVTITDPTGNYHFNVDQADNMSGVISVDYKFFNTMFVTYTLENNVVTVEGTLLGGGQKYLHQIKYSGYLMLEIYNENSQVFNASRFKQWLIDNHYEYPGSIFGKSHVEGKLNAIDIYNEIFVQSNTAYWKYRRYVLNIDFENKTAGFSETTGNADLSFNISDDVIAL